jgi:hypothetical protein
MTLRRLLPLLALLVALPARAAERYLAVLELSGTADRFALEALSDRVRSVASEALRGRWLVTTRENVLERLRRSGKTCTAVDTSCTVELGRAVGAELVLFGTVNAPPGAPLDVVLVLQDTGSGKQIGTVSWEFESALVALDGMRDAVTTLLQRQHLIARGPIDLYDEGFMAEGRAAIVAPSTGACAGKAIGALGVLASYRLRERWAVETLFEWDAYEMVDDHLVAGAVYHLGAGAEWTPFPSHRLALAGGLGAGLLRRKIYDENRVDAPTAAYASERETAPEAYLELRLNVNTSMFQFGARVGARAAWKRETLSSPSGNHQLAAGVQLDVPFMVAVRVAL